MSTIKAGDLVMIVKPKSCCGGGSMGATFIAGEIFRSESQCTACGHVHVMDDLAFDASDGDHIQTWRLKKIDPPAEGDSLPTRANLDQPATT